MLRPDDPRLTVARRVGARLVGQAQRSTSSVEVIRDGAALVVRVGSSLIRVRPDTPTDRAVAEREVAVARHLEGVAVPVTPLVDGDRQPWTVGDHIVTAWEWIPPGPSTDSEDLGRLARTLREHTRQVNTVGGGAPELAAFDPLGASVAAVAHLPVDDPEAGFVRHRAAALSGPFAAAQADDPAGWSVVHGDLHPANVVDGPHGALLTDLELAGWGGASYDAAPAVVRVVRYGARPEEAERFLAGFGADPRGWAGFDTYRSAYELWVTAWAVGVRDRDPGWAEEATRRVRSLRDGVGLTWSLR